MKILKIKTDSIAHLSYLLISGKEAAVIDPRRDSDIYQEKARQAGASIRYIFETHRNEDLVTGSRELQRLTDAPIYHGEGVDFEFGEFVNEGDEFGVGEVRLRILETPGHTPESISLAVYPDADCEEAVAVFTGDALFVDDVGRTDFFEDRLEEFAGMLYESLHDKILKLGDQVVIYPAHGAGSVCGGGIADRELSTIGYEKIHNPRLQLSRDEFVDFKVNEQHQYPPYFKQMESVNLKGDDKPLRNYDSIRVLYPPELAKNKEDYQVVDTRSVEAFIAAAVPGSYSIPADMVGAYAGYFLDYETPICLIAEDYPAAAEYCLELQRLGYDNTIYLLRGGLSAWETSGEAFQTLAAVTVEAVKQKVASDSVTLLDVRKPGEWEQGTIGDACEIFLGDLPDRLDKLKDEAEKEIIVYCGSGVRATVGASILARNGFDKVAVFLGSMAAWQADD